MSLGQRVRTILKEQKITQAEFAKMLGISVNYVALIVTDHKRSIPVPLAKLTEKSYGHSAQWVLDGSGEKLSASDCLLKKLGSSKKFRRYPAVKSGQHWLLQLL